MMGWDDMARYIGVKLSTWKMVNFHQYNTECYSSYPSLATDSNFILIKEYHNTVYSFIAAFHVVVHPQNSLSKLRKQNAACLVTEKLPSS